MDLRWVNGIPGLNRPGGSSGPGFVWGHLSCLRRTGRCRRGQRCWGGWDMYVYIYHISYIIIIYIYIILYIYWYVSWIECIVYAFFILRSVYVCFNCFTGSCFCCLRKYNRYKMYVLWFQYDKDMINKLNHASPTLDGKSNHLVFSCFFSAKVCKWNWL
jgi:hypothetical protein